jgi:glycosyltransferase involved in cell wall biosynthesis
VLITFDATPLLGRRTGVGRYVDGVVRELPAALARRGVKAQLRATTWTARGGRLEHLPPGVTQIGPRVPARLLRECWRRSEVPPIEMLVGRTDVFHATNFVSPPTRRAREVVMIHDLTYLDHSETVDRESLAYRTLVPRALDRGAHVVTPSETVADAVRARYGLDPGRVTATPLGVDSEWFDAQPAAPAWLESRDLPHDYIVFVGSIDPRKNLPRLLEAHALARAELTSVPELVLAGPAGRESSLAARPGVHLTGWLDDLDLRSLVAGSRALVLPSLDEGFGLPVLEALAAGRPVVTSSVPALCEVAGPHAEVAEPSDVEGLAAALVRGVSGNDDEPEREARRAWAREFTWARTADRTVDAYLGS